MAPPSALNFAGAAKPRFGKKGIVIAVTLGLLAVTGLAASLLGPSFFGKNSRLTAAGRTGNTTLAGGAQLPDSNLAAQDGLPNANLNLAGELPQASLEAPAAATTPTLVAPGAATPTLASASGMPQDIHDWLEHLRKTEAARNQLAKQQITSAMQTMASIQAQKLSAAMDTDASDDPSAKLRNEAAGLNAALQKEWSDLVAKFDSVAAPKECATAKAEYDQTLQATGAMMVEIIGIINSAADDPQAALSALRKMQGTSASRIDAHATATDNQVSSICAEYQTPKWFSISSDVGDSGLLAQAGL